MNTLNVCIGHIPFPQKYSHYVDLLLSPNIVSSDVKKRAIVSDEVYGENGHALSEYAQLFWLLNNIDVIAKGYDYLNIFQYRRFISRVPVDEEPVAGLPWASLVKENDLGKYSYCFEREQNGCCFNTAVNFGDVGVIFQYNEAHVLEDYLNFAQFLLEEKILDNSLVLRFIQQKLFVPSCSIGIYHVDVFKRMFSILQNAAKFIHSKKFIEREGYQRRSAGYLLERFHSYLIIEHFGDVATFGNNMLISPNVAFDASKGRVN